MALATYCKEIIPATAPNSHSWSKVPRPWKLEMASLWWLFLNPFYPSRFRQNLDLISVIPWLESEKTVICYKARLYWEVLLTWLFHGQFGPWEFSYSPHFLTVHCKLTVCSSLHVTHLSVAIHICRLCRRFKPFPSYLLPCSLGADIMETQETYWAEFSWIALLSSKGSCSPGCSPTIWDIVLQRRCMCSGKVSNGVSLNFFLIRFWVLALAWDLREGTFFFFLEIAEQKGWTKTRAEHF